MAKAKKNKGKGHKPKGIMGRSNIPYVQRMAIQRHEEIRANRDHSAQIAMFCTSVALHEIAGIGYKRLVKYSLHFKEIVDEFYEDPEVGMAHAKHRMEQFGMPISGELFAVENSGQSKREMEMENHSLQAAQIALICGAIAMNDEFGFGQERQTRISNRVSELTGRYAKEGKQFLLDEMEKIGFKIVNGTVCAYMDDDGNAVTPKRAKKEGYPDA